MRGLLASLLFVLSLLAFSAAGTGQAQACVAGSITFTNVNQDRTLNATACDTLIVDNGTYGGFFADNTGDAYSFYGLGVDDFGVATAEAIPGANATYTISSNLVTGVHTIRLIANPNNVTSDTLTLFMCPAVSNETCPTTRATTISVTLPVPPNITTTSVVDATAGAIYSQAISHTDGVGAVTFDISAGALPAGLTISGGGVISGTPTAGGTFSFTVRATDTNDWTDTQALTLTVGPAVIVVAPTTLPGVAAGLAYSQTITATGGIAPYTYTTTGPLPAGLTLATGGGLTGTATEVGSFDFTVTATDSATGTGPYTADQLYTLVVAAPVITAAPATLPDGTSGAAYSQTLTASGGTAPYSFSVAPEALPAGITLSSAGELSGTPTAGGVFNLAVTVTDSTTGAGAPYTGTVNYTLTIAAPTITVTPASVPGASAGVAYSTTFTASGGVGPHAFTYTGSLPGGLTLSSAGALTGTPTAAGPFNFTVTAADLSTGAGPYSGSQSVTLNVAAPTITVSPTTVAAATRGDTVNTTISASGGNAPYTYAVTAGALPTGIALSPGGVLSGALAASGAFNFTVTATDGTTGPAASYTGSRSYTWIVAAPTISLNALTGGTLGTPYSQTITASGGTGPYSFGVTSGALPAGLSLDGATGVVSGTPTQVGDFTVTITATDSSSNGGPYSGARTSTFSIAAPTLVMAGGPLTGGVVGQFASRQTGPATGGAAPYSYAVTGGSLPPGLTLNPATGALTGTPTMAGDYTFTVTATDSNASPGPYTVAATYTMSVAAVPVPTLTEWAMMLLGLLLGGSAVMTLRRRGATGGAAG